MKRSLFRSKLFIIASMIGLVSAVLVPLSHTNATAELSTVCDIKKDAFCIAPRADSILDPIDAATIPRIATPAWLQPASPASRSVKYTIETRGVIMVDLDEFASVANQTLNDSRGWSRLGVRFERVESEPDFVLVLSEASQMTTFSATGCDTTYSCKVGKYVIINQDRWTGGTPSWNDAGGSLSEYRQMVINHETGHWLGHGHTYCSENGQLATIMQQQSMSLQGCQPNAWPLGSEMYAPTLGIRS